MPEHVPLPHCRHRATRSIGRGPNGERLRGCCHCGARVLDDYYDDWDEPDYGACFTGEDHPQ